MIAAVARAEARSAGAQVEEQIDLLPPTRYDPKLDPLEHGRMAEAVRRDRRGRPPGATNKTTREMLEFIRKTIGDPMLESARVLGHTPETLARELGCDKLEAFDRLEKIRADLRPYFYAKQAPVDHDGKAVPGLTVEFHGHGAGSIGPDGADVPPWLRSQAPPVSDAQVQQNQQLIDVTPGQSHGERSHRSD
ncbi:hypothetical protein ASC80_01705 [Afipia sp. Root123D2]|nr:hypothetical protein ASC80_01705 [Afipia sp. Root123D2]